MYYYEIGYSSYEDSHCETLTHETEFNKDELEDMIAEGFKSLFPSACAKDLTFLYCFYINDEVNIYDWLVANKGFKKLKYTAISSIFGWGDLKTPTDWKREIGESSLYKKILQQIDSIESEDCDGWMQKGIS